MANSENSYQENGINFYIITYNYYKNGAFEKMQWHVKSSRYSLQTVDNSLQLTIKEKLRKEFPQDNYELQYVEEHSYPLYKMLFLELGGIVEE